MLREVTDNQLRRRVVRHNRVARQRRGAALTELAICLPVMCILVFGAMELTDTVFLKQRLSSIAYETAALYAEHNPAAQQLGDDIAKARKVKNAKFTVTYSNSSADPNTRLITVTVSAKASDNSLLRLGFVSSLSNTISAPVTVAEH
jgi:Flp pilus assembly protein TadG